MLTKLENAGFIEVFIRPADRAAALSKHKGTRRWRRTLHSSEYSAIKEHLASSMALTGSEAYLEITATGLIYFVIPALAYSENIGHLGSEDGVAVLQRIGIQL